MKEYHFIIGTARGCGKTQLAKQIAEKYGAYQWLSPSQLVKPKIPTKAVIIELSKFDNHEHFDLNDEKIVEIYTVHKPDISKIDVSVLNGKVTLHFL